MEVLDLATNVINLFECFPCGIIRDRKCLRSMNFVRDSLLGGRRLCALAGIDGRSVRRLIPLGFLAPRIIETIAEGHQPVELTVEALTRRIDLPLLWSAQVQALGMK